VNPKADVVPDVPAAAVAVDHDIVEAVVECSARCGDRDFELVEGVGSEGERIGTTQSDYPRPMTCTRLQGADDDAVVPECVAVDVAVG
jgi:hypothetical protein